jgi:hypothetical protein
MRYLFRYVAAAVMIVVLVSAVTGCTGTGDTTNSGQPSNGDSATSSGQLMTVGSHITQTETGEQAVKLYVRNSGSTSIASALVTVKFYNNTGVLIHTESQAVTDINPNSGKNVIVPCYSEEAISNYEISISIT